MIRLGIQFILALAAWNCLAQIPGWSPVELSRVQRVDAVVSDAGFYTPTNLPSQAAYTWHVSQDYTTNSGMGTLPDRISGLNATNTAGSGTPLEGPSLNSKRTLNFDGTTKVLFAQPFDTGAQPYSFHFVIALTNAAAASGLGIVGSTNNSGNAYAGYVGTTARAQFRAGATSANPGYFETNKWMSVVYIWNGANSQVWTNGVQLGSDVTIGAGDFEGLELGRLGLNSAFDTKFTLAEFATYTNAALTAANISNLFSYATNTYAFGY